MYYVLDEHGNKIEAFSKQDILDLFTQAIEDGRLNNISPNTGYVLNIKCCVGNTIHKLAFVTKAVYDDLVSTGGKETNALYFITDDTTAQDIEDIEILNANGIQDLQAKYDEIAEAMQALGF